MAMLFLGRHRGLCHLRHHHKTVSLPYKLLHRGLKVAGVPGYKFAVPGSNPGYGSRRPAQKPIHPSFLGCWINGYLGKPGEGNCGNPGVTLALCPGVTGPHPPQALRANATEMSTEAMHRLACDLRPSADEVVAGRRGQAQRSLLVEVVGAASVAELWRVCEGCGTVEALHHYTVPARGSVGRKEMILVEFSEASALQSALQISTHAPLKDCPPSHSPLVWLAAGRGAPTPPNNTQQPPLNLTSEGTQEELLLRLSQCSSVESALSGLFPNAVVLPFGSSVNTFGHRDSDLDMTLELGGQGGKAQGGEGRLVFQVKRSSSAANPRLTLQRRMEVTADLLDHFMPGCSQVRRILNARVPIIKYRQELTAIDCDLTMANRSGYHMSRMLHLYGTADSRVVALGGAIRRWARGRGLTSPHAGRWLTNFSLTLMVLTYLMNTSPPVLLPLSVLKVIPGEDEESGQPIFIVPQQSASAAAAAAAKNTDPLEPATQGFLRVLRNF
ncbi:Poly(A) RNA polymerase, mitochondrial [Chionoecetes opilio]|uniref:Poly(A) RNA polymerase, mitochondrial n=1 Tax=Chionoecetes opilio TaxID=41210 RepID=A0A8J4YHM4_CHIOP|nr:Poly(A) RNA polymerase, mitochondrial [Chionoecetes opilio]